MDDYAARQRRADPERDQLFTFDARPRQQLRGSCPDLFVRPFPPVQGFGNLPDDRFFVNDLAATIKEAFYIATTGRPGPVLVDIPKDVSMAKADFTYPNSVSIRGYHPVYDGNKWQIKQAAEAITKAKKPIL